ncbi:unnamed protein product [Periconia digitata]|uniref:Uncharacterized protein n=1 Tax=Periconia digitata TaxID=1303443 RepID=A0A9W4UTV7_9PLEO|nr:unnamed protein product [Periconia digitata]
MKTQTPLYLLVFLLSTAATAQYCYYANGVVADVTSDYLPCPYRPVNTICCSMDRKLAPGSETPNPSLVQDVCLDNGLCMNNHTVDGQAQVAYYVNGCTNEDPKAPECFSLCERKSEDASSSLRVTPCSGTSDSEKWCCGNSDKCCSDGTAITVPAVFGQNLNGNNNKTSEPSSSSSSSSSAPPTASSNPPQSNPGSSPQDQQQQQQSNPSSGLSTAAKAGIAVGAVGGAAALIGALFFVLKALAWKKKSKENSNPYSPASPNPFLDQNHPQMQMQQQQQQQQQPWARGATHELDSPATTPHLASAVPAGSIKYAHETATAATETGMAASELPAVTKPVEIQGRADPVELPAEARER